MTPRSARELSSDDSSTTQARLEREVEVVQVTLVLVPQACSMLINVRGRHDALSSPARRLRFCISARQLDADTNSLARTHQRRKTKTTNKECVDGWGESGGKINKKKKIKKIEGVKTLSE